MWHYHVPQIPWTDLMANNASARALVALKSGFRTGFNTVLSKLPFSLPFTLPMTAPLTLLTVKGHTQDRLSSQGTQRSLTCVLSLGPASGLWKKDPRQPGVLAWTKHSTPHRKALSRDFDPEPFFLPRGGAFLNHHQAAPSSIKRGPAASTGAHYIIATTVGWGRNGFHWWEKNVESRRKLSDCQPCQACQEWWLRARVSAALP